MNIEKLVLRICQHLIRSWNEKEIHGMLEYLSPKLVIHSPNISKFYLNTHSNTLEGIENVTAYWNQLLQSPLYYQVRLESYVRNNNTVKLTMSVIKSTKILILNLEYNQYGKVTWMNFDFK